MVLGRRRDRAPDRRSCHHRHHSANTDPLVAAHRASFRHIAVRAPSPRNPAQLVRPGRARPTARGPDGAGSSPRAGGRPDRSRHRDGSTGFHALGRGRHDPGPDPTLPSHRGCAPGGVRAAAGDVTRHCPGPGRRTGRSGHLGPADAPARGLPLASHRTTATVDLPPPRPSTRGPTAPPTDRRPQRAGRRNAHLSPVARRFRDFIVADSASRNGATGEPTARTTNNRGRDSAQAG